VFPWLHLSFPELFFYPGHFSSVLVDFVPSPRGKTEHHPIIAESQCIVPQSQTEKECKAQGSSIVTTSVKRPIIIVMQILISFGASETLNSIIEIFQIKG